MVRGGCGVHGRMSLCGYVSLEGTTYVKHLEDWKLKVYCITMRQSCDVDCIQ